MVDSLTACQVQAAYLAPFAAGLLLTPNVFFKGGFAQYWETSLPEDSVLAWFVGGFGSCLTGLAVMNGMASAAE